MKSSANAELLKNSKKKITIRVFEFPPKESCRSRVSFEFLYGMWVDRPSTSAEITFPSVERDKLILLASFRRIPVAPVLLCLSEPCKYFHKSLKCRIIEWQKWSMLKIREWRMPLKLAESSGIECIHQNIRWCIKCIKGKK